MKAGNFFQRFLLPGFVFQSVIISGGHSTGRELVEFFMGAGPIATTAMDALKFPRNVNATVACALATVGLDAARARFIADRRLQNKVRGEFEFTAKDGALLAITKEEPASGVSSTGMIGSLKGRVLRALELPSFRMKFV